MSPWPDDGRAARASTSDRPVSRRSPMSQDLPPSAARATLPPEVEARIDEACLRFEAAWQSGARPRLADFLTEMGEEHRANLLVQMLPIELHYRRLRGETPTPREYVTSFA